jgi:hypothetical protein
MKKHIMLCPVCGQVTSETFSKRILDKIYQKGYGSSMTTKELENIDGKTIIIKWLQGITLDVTTSIENDEPVGYRATFDKGETIEVDVFGIDTERNTTDIQFGDGSVATAVQTNLFTIESTEE